MLGIKIKFGYSKIWVFYISILTPKLCCLGHFSLLYQIIKRLCQGHLGTLETNVKFAPFSIMPNILAFVVLDLTLDFSNI